MSVSVVLGLLLVGLLAARQTLVRVVAGLALLLGVMLAHDPLGSEVHTLLDRVQILLA